MSRLSRIISPVSGRVMFERGTSGGGFRETVFRLGRWVLALTYDTKRWGGSRQYHICLRREPEANHDQ